MMLYLLQNSGQDHGEMAADNPPHASWCILSYAEFMRDDKIIDWKTVYDDPNHKEFKEWFDDKTLEFSAYKDGRD